MLKPTLQFLIVERPLMMYENSVDAFVLHFYFFAFRLITYSMHTFDSDIKTCKQVVLALLVKSFPCKKQNGF